MVEQCGATVEQCWLNSGVEQWNSVCGTVLWNSAGETVEQWNSLVEQFGGTMK